MKKPLAILATLAAIIYGAAAYTRPHEPAGRWLHSHLHGHVLPGELPATGGLQAAPIQRDPATETKLEIHSLRSAGYTLEECCEIYNATTDIDCHAIERDYYTPAELDEIYPSH